MPAASPSVDIGTGITIAFGTSGFSAQIMDVTPPGQERESIETSHQGTVNGKTFTPADLYDPGGLEFEIHFNPDTVPPIDDAVEEIIITWPAGATWTFDGFMTGYAPSAPLNDKMVATVTVKVSGEIDIDGAATASA